MVIADIKVGQRFRCPWGGIWRRAADNDPAVLAWGFPNAEPNLVWAVCEYNPAKHAMHWEEGKAYHYMKSDPEELHLLPLTEALTRLEE